METASEVSITFSVDASVIVSIVVLSGTAKKNKIKILFKFRWGKKRFELDTLLEEHDRYFKQQNYYSQNVFLIEKHYFIPLRIFYGSIVLNNYLNLYFVAKMLSKIKI